MKASAARERDFITARVGRRLRRNVVCSAWVLAAGVGMTLAWGGDLGRVADTDRVGLGRDVDEVRAWIAGQIGQPRFEGATWGIEIRSLDTGAVVFEHNANKRLRPASNVKLFAAALALDRLGPDHRIRTSILAAAPPDSAGAVPGDLFIRGRGDFSMSARFREDGEDPDEPLSRVVTAIEQAGVRRVDGRLVGDASWFHGPTPGAGWAWEDLAHAYGAGVSALIHNDNVIELLIRPGLVPGELCRISTRPRTDYLGLVNRTMTVEARDEAWIELRRLPGVDVVHVVGQLPRGGATHVEQVPVHDPALWFVTRLAGELERRGIRVSGEPSAIDWMRPRDGIAGSGGELELAAIESPPMRDLISPMMKRSQNAYAQALWLHVGATLADPTRASAGSHSTDVRVRRPLATEESARVLAAFLLAAGIDSGDVFLDEGSGLSRRAFATPRAIVRLLEYMHRHVHGESFRVSLPVAGVDGTLRDRMRGTPAEGRVLAKTGGLVHTFALSGYAHAASGETFAFAILLNHHHAPGSEDADPRADLDAIAIRLAGIGSGGEGNEH
jgi:serine-type D-Ala-D-Ala carboxypeptidase/endopeptidase (penicillin-binding protein 4)